MSAPPRACPADADLAALSGPDAVRDVPAGELPELAARIRAFLIESVCAVGGHLGPNLGMVELTLALHRVFDSPRDALVFDTGHQAYVHKLLTGRAKGFATLRQAGGLSGYPPRSESVHDLVENSHASTALAYADGLAKARALSGEQDRAVVAVIGDGALTGGLAFEALNNLGAAPDRPVIVVLNDNGRSYAPTTGALAAHLNTLRFGGVETSRNVFTDLGFVYFGPVDGHNTTEIEDVLQRARALDRPVVVHVMTVKGKGYRPAESDEADCLHAVGTVDVTTGKPAPTNGTVPAPSWTSVFGTELVTLAERRTDVVAVTAAMLRPTGLHFMAQRFPRRVFDVGIAEQHAVTSAAALAMGGYHPIVAIYATFLNRAVDQVLMDVALHRLPVTFVLDRAGITGPDGPSHHGMWDLALLPAVPGLKIAAPRDATRLRQLLGEAALSLPKTTPTPSPPSRRNRRSPSSRTSTSSPATSSRPSTPAAPPSASIPATSNGSTIRSATSPRPPPRPRCPSGSASTPAPWTPDCWPNTVMRRRRPWWNPRCGSARCSRNTASPTSRSRSNTMTRSP